MATHQHSTPLSELFRDPVLREAFRRGERDNGAAFAVPAPKPPKLLDGAAVKPPCRELVSA